MRPGALILCVHKAGRSQMAAGFIRTHGGDSVEVFSAGSEPAASLNPAAVEAMREVGIDIAAQTPRQPVGGDDRIGGPLWSPWAVATPAPMCPAPGTSIGRSRTRPGRDLDLVRPIRDELERRVKALLAELVGGPAQPT